MKVFYKHIGLSLFCFPYSPAIAAPVDDFATGAGFTAGNALYAPLKAAVLAIVLVWLAWLVVAAYRSWSASNSDSVSFVSIVLRVALMFIVTGAILDMTYS